MRNRLKLEILQNRQLVKTMLVVIMLVFTFNRAICQCDANSLPLYEDFTSVAVNEMPAGWTTATHQDGQWVFNGPNWEDIHTTSSKTVSVPVNGTRKYYLITPKISIDDISRCMISFNIKGTGSYMELLTLKIGVMTDPTDLNTFVEVQTVSSLIYTNAFQLVMQSLASYNGNGKYVAFYFECSSYPNIEMDNIRIDYADSWTSNEVQIGTGTSTTDVLPIYCSKPGNNYFFQSWSNIIYTASELGNAPLSINKIAFYYGSSTKLDNTGYNHDFKVYIMQTSKSSFNSASEILTSQNMTLVYDGFYSMRSGWNEMPLSQTFEYDGTSNILVAIYFSGFWNRDNYNYNFRYTASSNKCVYFKSGSNGSINYESGTVSGTGGSSYISSNRPNIKFLYLNEQKCRPPKNFSATVDCPNVNLSWTAASGLTSPTYKIYRDGTQIGETSSTTYADNSVSTGDYEYSISVSSTSPSCNSGKAYYKVCGLNCCDQIPPTITVTERNRHNVISWAGYTHTGDVTGYEVYRNGSRIATINIPTTTSYDDTGLTNGTTYSYYVIALSNTAPYCAQNKSNVETGTPHCTSVTPPNNVAIASNGLMDRAVKIQWTHVSGATGNPAYKIYYGSVAPAADRSNASSVYVWNNPTIESSGSTRSCTLPRLTNGETYYFAVMPVGSGENCEDNNLSNSVSGKPKCE